VRLPRDMKSAATKHYKLARMSLSRQSLQVPAMALSLATCTGTNISFHGRTHADDIMRTLYRLISCNYRFCFWMDFIALQIDVDTYRVYAWTDKNCEISML
jgi:hypothetical protein